jgi:hypothetical protein
MKDSEVTRGAVLPQNGGFIGEVSSVRRSLYGPEDSACGG